MFRPGSRENVKSEKSLWPFLALLSGNAALALGPWLVRLADTGPVAAGFWRPMQPGTAAKA